MRQAANATVRRLPIRAALVLVLAGGLAAAALAVDVGAKAHIRGGAAARRPNIVFVLTDDLSWNLVSAQFMPHVLALENQGETFDHYIVSDSLCCPSRSSIFTGLFPHDSGVFSNTGRDGGYRAFIQHRPNLESRTFAVAIQRGGYLTSMMGKYLNGYGQPVMTTHVPSGWSDWHVAGNGYYEFNYSLNENGRVRHYGPPPPRSNAAHYLTDVLAARATSFINRAANAQKPFAIEIATFAPHFPYAPAPRNANDFPGLTEPRDPSFNGGNANPPDWLKHARLTARDIRKIDREFRKRVQADEAVDRLVARVEATLATRHLQGNTYIVFSSDNGYHMGQHRLLPGKMTAFDTDVRVPLIIVGPGVPHRTVSAIVQNVDLYPTFVQLSRGRSAPAIDGHSLVGLLHPGQGQLKWRTAALIEHHGASDVRDPDFENGERGGNPPRYEAVRLSDRQFGEAVYVEYPRTGQREYYDINRDPFERSNIYGALSSAERLTLHRTLAGLERCHGPTSCWAAGQPQ